MKILLAEDEPDVRLITRLALEDAGCHVVAVGDGKEALALALREPFDVALLDVMMPQLDGFDTCASLRTNPHTQSLPVIFLTARAHEAEVQRGLTLGAQGYIIKPFDVFTLAEHIQSILRTSGFTRP